MAQEIHAGFIELVGFIKNHSVYRGQQFGHARFPHGQIGKEQVVVDDHHVGRLHGGVGAGAAHGDAQVGTGQGGGVVDAVAHHGHHLAVAVRVLLQTLDVIGLVRRQHFGDDLLDIRKSQPLFVEDVDPTAHELVVIGLVARRPGQDSSLAADTGGTETRDAPAERDGDAAAPGAEA